MYAPAYGYGPGNGPQAQTPHHQSQQQVQHHQPGQQPQHMMYNPQAQQQYGGHQSPYGGAPGQVPGMGGNAGAMGMMQNTGMAQMPASHVSTYQTPYSSSPYGGNIPTSTAANMPPNFMPTTSNAPSFPMNAPSMNPQHQAQRMQPPPPSSTPTQPGARMSPFANVQHNTPPNTGQAQSQFSTPQNNSQTHLQTPNNNPQGQGQAVVTPQTPNFPPGSNAGQIATPLSPGSESREKERVTLLLEINNGLLKEVMRVQAIQAEVKKDGEAAAASPEADKEKLEKEKAEKLKTPSREYVECMRRLQSNLAYLAAIADRSHKPSSQIPPHPAIMSAPPLSPKAPPTNATASPKSDTKKEETEDKKLEDQPQDQSAILNDLYSKLQVLFPGVDPKKEPPIPAANQVARAQAQQQAAAQIQAQKQAQGQGQSGADPNAQQKMQNDMLRQKMMQQQAQQQSQNQQQQQQMGQGMQQMNNTQQQGQVQSR
ncbi:uncharacterized protein PAC_12233 [Phialocephala subalpina]|uniref:CYC8-general repressor of transcription n=1 Tax=Phialocephala subalpina TaxID=576137 RepID=A0A1L7XBG3_9HELO|nr:uncharacterized protein PAC_12233 [Phialocephala subalpina]